jgi:hypothetical protein
MRREWGGWSFITGFLRIDFIYQHQDFLVTGDVAHAEANLMRVLLRPNSGLLRFSFLFGNSFLVSL